MKCYHGTTLSNFKTLMAGGDKEASLWACSSEDGLLYVYPADKAASESGLEREDFESQSVFDEGVLRAGRQLALESATLTAAFGMSDTTLVVFELDIDESLLEDDWSCENMSSIASFIDADDFTPEMVTRCWVYDFKGMYSPFFIPINNKETRAIPAELTMLATLINKSNCFVWEELRETIESTCEEKDKNVLLNS